MNNWRTVSPDMTNGKFDVLLAPQAIAVDDEYFFINGGFTTDKFATQTLQYSASENKFYQEFAYTEPPYGTRQIYYGSAVNVPGKGIALYGGFEVNINNTWVTNATDTSSFNFNGNLSRAIGYVQPVFFNPDNSTKDPWSTPLDRMTRQQFFASHLQGIYDPVKQYILYLGGEKRSNNPVNYTQNAFPRPFSEGLAFSTVTNSWIPIWIKGDVPPSGRYGFTLTLLPSTNRHVLLYGGDDNGNVSGSYCYILDLDQLIWRQVYVKAPAGTTLARTDHQTVLVNNNTVFVVWGKDANNNGVEDMVMLNVSNPKGDITLLTKYIDPNAPAGDEDSNYDGGDAGLGTGGKAGVAVACVIAAVFAGLVVAFFYRRKKNRERRNRERQEMRYEFEQSHNHDPVPMEVDWDKIEEKYIELPQTNFGTGSSASTTVPDHHAPPPAVVHPDGIDLERPNAYETHHRPQKPDGFA